MAQNENGTTGPLTEEEITIVRESWDKLYVKKNRKPNGIKLFVNLFTMYPSSKGMFSQFKDVPLEDIPKHPKLGAHATNVMYNLASYMDYLEDTDDLKELIRKTARNHVNRGVGAKEFQWLAKPIMAILDEVLGDDSTQALKDAWAKVLGVIVSVVDEEANAKGE